MRLKPYPKYRASGIEWLGDVPEHWFVAPLGRISFDADSVFIDGDWIESKDISEEGFRYLTSGNIGEGVFKEQGQGFISETTFAELNCTEVLSGDVLISRLNLPIGRACIAPNLGSRMVTCVDNVIVRPNQNVDRQFLVYMLTSKEHFANMENLARGTTMQRISRSTLSHVRFASPPKSEQSTIAEFLDRETAKIDTLISKQKRLIQLLKEKRQAVISHAVTKGMNPNVQMKHSGVEWLGDVPEHWEVKRLKYLCNVQTGDKDTVDALEDGQYPFYVRSQTIERINTFTFDCEAILTAGDGAGVGKVFHYHNGPFDFHQRVYMLNNFHEIIGRFMFYFLSENFHRVALDGGAKSTVDSLRMPLFLNFCFTVAPIEEQSSIAAFLDRETAKIDTLIAKAEQAITLQKEHRTALISAAVTGKIDVREAA